MNGPILTFYFELGLGFDKYCVKLLVLQYESVAIKGLSVIRVMRHCSELFQSVSFNMSKKRSSLWSHYQEKADDPTTVVCKIGECRKEISRGKSGTPRSRLSNTGMRSHLKNCHAKEWQEFLSTEKDVEDAKAAADEQVAEADETESGGVPLFDLRSSKKRRSFFQQNLPEMIQLKETYDIHDERAKSKHRALLTMMVTDLQPFRMVNDPGFLNYSKLLDPRFAVGSDIFYRRLLEKAFEKGKVSVQQKLIKEEPSCVSIQLDGWSAHKHGYVGLLVNYINKDWRRAKICLACGSFDQSHTGQNLATWVENECDSWGITESVGVVTTDTASNMYKMMQYLPFHFSHGDCINHVMQLVINDELLKKPSVKNLVKVCRHICTFSNQSVQLSQFIVKKQIEAGKEKRGCLNLLQDVVTRWNSTFLMLQRFLQLQPVMRSVLLDQDWKNKLDVNISNADWSLMEKVVKVLGVFLEATERFSSPSACISEVIPTVTGLLVTLNVNDRDDVGVKDFKRKLKESLERRLGDKETLDQYAVATLLDPRYLDYLIN